MPAKGKSEKPSALANAIPAHGWKDWKDYKPENREQLRKSMRIALSVLDIQQIAT